MSVREGDRQESNLKYIQDAEKLCAHTLQMCNNSNHFPESSLANQMKEEAIQVLCNLRYNLSAYTLNKKDTKTLFKYQLAAMAHLDALQSLLGQAYDNNFYHIDSKSVEYWIGLIVAAEESIKKLGLIPICQVRLRSPYWYSPAHERYVSSSGGATSDNANNSYAVMPDCKESYSQVATRLLKIDEKVLQGGIIPPHQREIGKGCK